MQIFTLISLLAITMAASFFDSRGGIIPNRLCIAGSILALASRVIESRRLPIEELPGIFSILILFLLAYRFHRIGGGDVKLITVLLFLLPFRSSLLLLWLTMFLAGVAGIIGFCTMRIRYLRLGPAMFLASLAITSIGGVT